ncbi:hypothetical protein MHU86_9411 [Fragilaria crotonensis]|nr:hypothetical protein MHU86_9411 [Fragilaria crotonensis]
MENRNSADDADNAVKVSSGAGIQEHGLAEEFPSELPSMAMSSSAPSGSSSTAKDHDDRDDAHGAGRVGDTKKLEHALPTELMQFPAGLGMADSMGKPPVVYASNSDIAPGAFPVVPSFHNMATSETLKSRPRSSCASPKEVTNDDSKQVDGVPNSAVAGSALYTVKAQRVPDGKEDGMVIVAEAEHLGTKWYQRRWIVVGLALLACCFVAAVVVTVVLFLRQPSASSSSSPEQIACNFLSIPDVTKCRSSRIWPFQ